MPGTAGFGFMGRRSCAGSKIRTWKSSISCRIASKDRLGNAALAAHNWIVISGLPAAIGEFQFNTLPYTRVMFVFAPVSSRKIIFRHEFFSWNSRQSSRYTSARSCSLQVISKLNAVNFRIFLDKSGNLVSHKIWNLQTGSGNLLSHYYQPHPKALAARDDRPHIASEKFLRAFFGSCAAGQPGRFCRIVIPPIRLATDGFNIGEKQGHLRRYLSPLPIWPWTGVCWRRRKDL